MADIQDNTQGSVTENIKVNEAIAELTQEARDLIDAYNDINPTEIKEAIRENKELINEVKESLKELESGSEIKNEIKAEVDIKITNLKSEFNNKYAEVDTKLQELENKGVDTEALKKELFPYDYVEAGFPGIFDDMIFKGKTLYNTNNAKVYKLENNPAFRFVSETLPLMSERKEGDKLYKFPEHTIYQATKREHMAPPEGADFFILDIFSNTPKDYYWSGDGGNGDTSYLIANNEVELNYKQGTEPTNPTLGDVWLDTRTNTYNYYANVLPKTTTKTSTGTAIVAINMWINKNNTDTWEASLPANFNQYDSANGDSLNHIGKVRKKDDGTYDFFRSKAIFWQEIEKMNSNDESTYPFLWQNEDEVKIKELESRLKALESKG